MQRVWTCLFLQKFSRKLCGLKPIYPVHLQRPCAVRNGARANMDVCFLRVVANEQGEAATCWHVQVRTKDCLTDSFHLPTATQNVVPLIPA